MLDLKELREVVKDAVREAMLESSTSASAEYDTSKYEVDKTLLSRREAARQLSVSVQTIATLIRDGTLEHVRVRRRVLIPYKSILDYFLHQLKSPSNGGRQ